MDKMREEQGNLTQTNRENTKIQINLEGDCRSLSNNVESSESTHLEHKLHQDKDKAFDEENKARHDLEVKLVTALKTRKTEEKTKLQQDLDQIEKDFLAKGDYQGALKETKELREAIEAAKVKIQFLDIQVQMLTEMTEQLNNKREELIEEKKLADSKNEELKTQLKAQEEIANKRLQQKLNREKSAEIKELLANDEMIKAENDDMQNKFRAEKENYDNLLRDKMELVERLARLNVELADDTKVVEEQDKLLLELRTQIEAEVTEVTALEEKCLAARKIKKIEDERNRHVQQQFTALEAKKEFIETNYDYTSAPADMNLEIFKQIVHSNNEVNETVEGFVGKVDVVKKEVSKIIASRYTF